VILLGALLVASGAYWLAAIAAALRFRGLRRPAPGFEPPVSILKPVRGSDPNFYSCIRSHAAQNYPEFELLFAVRDPADPAISDIQRLAAEFPQRRIEVFLTEREYGANAKVNGLERLRSEARHGVLLVSDSDIRVGPDFLRRAVAPLSDFRTGMVTCPYRGVPGRGLPALLEALWISTDFQPSVLIARLLGVDFALGATLVFRRAHLEQIGGFAPVASYLADDYQLGIAIRRLGLRIILSDYAVTTVLPAASWRASWRHRLRWGRTLRVCRPAGYAGLLITFALPIAAAGLLIAPVLWPLALAAAGLRFAAAGLTSSRILGDPLAPRYWPLLPVADLVSLAVWFASLFGRTVVWRGERFTLRRDGTMRPSRPGF
jgi:ceramide glucosyltransferase